MTIGGLARAAGVGVETVRYYERIGLLEKPARQGAYRRYGQSHLLRLRYILNAKALQLSLSDIANLSREIENGTGFCSAVRASVRSRLAAVDAEIERLGQTRRGLAGFLHTCGARPADQPCPVLADLRPPETSS